MAGSGVVSVGKARIKIDVSGCYSCGTDWSSGWRPVKNVAVTVGGRKMTVAVNCCADCLELGRCQAEACETPERPRRRKRKS